MELCLPKYVTDSLITIENQGFEAWCVGGAVRDHIMNLTPTDYDITTNAKPEIIMSLFPKTVPTGIKHGTVTVVTSDGNIEVTTYRSDGSYSDNRSPDNVQFVGNVEDDLKRRDFTVNAILYNPKKGFYDPLNGLKDINEKTLRCIGNPDERFTEDALRILRLFRFSAQLNFDIDDNTFHSAIKLSYLLKNISVERIFVELKRIISSSNPNAFNFLLKCGALQFLGFSSSDMPLIINDLRNDFSLRFAVLCFLNNVNGVMILKHLNADNLTIDNVMMYCELLSLSFPTTKASVKRMLKISSVEHLKGLIDYYRCSGKDTTYFSEMLYQIIDSNEPYLIKDLKINGNDLIKLGYNGSEIGEKFDMLLECVIENPLLNSKEKLLELIKSK